MWYAFIVKVQREQSNVVILSSGLKLTGMISFVRIGFILLGHSFIESLSWARKKTSFWDGSGDERNRADVLNWLKQQKRMLGITEKVVL